MNKAESAEMREQVSDLFRLGFTRERVAEELGLTDRQVRSYLGHISRGEPKPMTSSKTYKPAQLVSDRRIAELYAGRRYG